MMVSENRNYSVINTEQAKELTERYLANNEFDIRTISFGLPEIYDRYHIWNVPVLYKNEVIGEIAVDAYTSKIDLKLSSNISVLKRRIDKILSGQVVSTKRCK